MCCSATASRRLATRRPLRRLFHIVSWARRCSPPCHQIHCHLHHGADCASYRHIYEYCYGYRYGRHYICRHAAQELFAEDEFIVEARKAQMAQRAENARFAKETGASSSELDGRQGFAPGTYVRIVLEEVPCEFSECFDRRFPLIVGGLQPGEERMGFSMVRLKKHRWHKKVGALTCALT